MKRLLSLVCHFQRMLLSYFFSSTRWLGKKMLCVPFPFGNLDIYFHHYWFFTGRLRKRIIVFTGRHRTDMPYLAIMGRAKPVSFYEL